MPEWQDVVGGMMKRFGKDPGTVGILLGFLKALVEEAGNSRIPLSVSVLPQEVWTMKLMYIRVIKLERC
jgi:hypothetical protein